jgi:hypothetical protein
MTFNLVLPGSKRAGIRAAQLTAVGRGDHHETFAQEDYLKNLASCIVFSYLSLAATSSSCRSESTVCGTNAEFPIDDLQLFAAGID